MKRTTRILCALIICCIAIEVAKAQTAKVVSREPSVFTPEEENGGVFHNAPHPSDVVLDALFKTKEAKEYGLRERGREEARNLFKAVKVHLANPDEVDWIVLGSDQMSGADNNWFWVVREVGNHAEVLLYANALGLATLSSQTNGYKDIKTHWNAPSGYAIDETFKYDGNRYKVISKHNYKMSQ